MKYSALRQVAVVIPLVLLVTAIVVAPVRIAAADADPDDATCVGCHDGYDKTLAGTTHQLGSTIKNAAVSVSCVSCHSGGAVHAADPSKSNISNPAAQSGAKALETCTKCHLPHQELDNYGTNVHTLQQLNCADCHRLHASKPSPGLLVDDKAEFCNACHGDIKSRFMSRSNHPVRQNVMTCLSCHRFTKRVDQNQAYDFARLCQDCHTDVAGPYPYEHGAVNAYSVQGSGCVECHDPHGSENDKLLRQPGNQMCLQCHAVPTHTTAHDGAYAHLNCLTCHTDIHGSMTGSKLLDPNIGAKLGRGSCYCHSLN